MLHSADNGEIAVALLIQFVMLSITTFGTVPRKLHHGYIILWNVLRDFDPCEFMFYNIKLKLL